jgi:hypothetical protein
MKELAHNADMPLVKRHNGMVYAHEHLTQVNYVIFFTGGYRVMHK